MRCFIKALWAVILTAGVVHAQQAPPQIRAVYVPTFDTNTEAAANQIIDRILTTNLNQVFIQVRSRGDAYYYPNRDDDTYPNPEPRGQLWTISPSDLDTLQLYIDRLHNANPPREVHAWVTTYNTWNRTANNPSSPAHVYNAHPEWITTNAAGIPYTPENDAPLDPGIPEVREYLYNVFMDIVRNYDVDGLHFDYIRLIGADSGYNPLAKAQFLADTGWNYDTQNAGGRLNGVYKVWRRDQISLLVQDVYEQVMLEKPWVAVTAFLVAFTDSVENLGQGYNWWVTNGVIDALHPGVYSSAVNTNVTRWNAYVTKLAQNNSQFTRPMAAAIGSYLFIEAGDPGRNLQAVNALETNARKPDGYNFFAQRALFTGGTPNADQIARDLFNPGGPMDTWAPVPALAHKAALGAETIPPNPPANLQVSLANGFPRITFQRPAPAADGDLPVHYRLYRDTQPNVRHRYDGLAMEWWDPGSPRTSFQFDDVAAPQGNFYYAAVAYDDWNNQARSVTGPVQVSGTEYIIETRAGGKNVGDYSESGVFTDSTSHSTAPGTTASIGSRFALPGDSNGRNDQARFTPSALGEGTYEVFVTCFNVASANAQNVTVRIVDSGGTRTSTIDLTLGNAGNVWYPVGTMSFVPGSGHYVEFDNTTQSNVGTSTDLRMNAAAVRFVTTSPEEPVAREPKPPAPPAPLSPVTEVIVDSQPISLNYDDRGSTDNWQNSTVAGYYNSNARFYSSTRSFPPTSVAVWAVDLPRAGRWAIDGWVRNNTGFAQGAQYRFVDGDGVVRNTVASHRTGTEDASSGGWFINVDGATDENAYYFGKGRVYITLYGNASGAQTLIADALRFRLIEPELIPSPTAWSVH